MKRDELIKAVRNYLVKTGRPAMQLKAAFIDMDGTLYDTMPWHAKAWHRMVTEIGIECTQEEFFNYEGMTGKATVSLLFERAGRPKPTDAEVTELYGRKAAYFRQMGTPRMMPGAKEMVETFYDSGMKTVIVTGSAQSSILDRVNKDYNGRFPANMRITAHDVRQGKPSPEPYMKALELCGLKPYEAIVVENAPLGVESGVAAGIFTIGVNTGPLTPRSLYDAGADIVFNSMTECAETLVHLLDTINSERLLT